MRVGGLFSGIGGFELAFTRQGDEAEFLCDIDDGCRLVLAKRFPDVEKMFADIREVRSLPRVDVLTAGFPCQDYSQAGKTAGITGDQGALFGEIVRLLTAKSPPTWVVLENVPFILSLHGGAAMHHIANAFEILGFRWAYRIVDALAFGKPQRRRRWIFVASRTEDPRGVLFADSSERLIETRLPKAYGFYWTEGSRGLGLALDAIPPLKVGSGFNIPTSPAIWDRKRHRIVTPHIRDAERLQGFPRNWTQPVAALTPRARWRMVGNAVSVPTASWVAQRLRRPGVSMTPECAMPASGWPAAAWGESGMRRQVKASDRPRSTQQTPILEFLKDEALPLSSRATTGFLRRLSASTLRRPDGFVEDLLHHIDAVRAI